MAVKMRGGAYEKVDLRGGAMVARALVKREGVGSSPTPAAKCTNRPGWCNRCLKYHDTQAPARAPSTKALVALPCGCKLKNRQGAWLSGRYAPTKLLEDGTRLCRCGKRWELLYVEIEKD